MALSIYSNVTSLVVGKQLQAKTNAVNKDLEKLASGKRINSAADDPAGLAVALQLAQNADLSGIAQQNISYGASAAAIAEGTIATASDLTTRMAELATQSANGTLSDSQRASLDSEYQSLKLELDRISQSTEFNGQPLLSGGDPITLHVGVDGSANSQLSLALPNVSSSGLGLASSIATKDGAKAAISETQNAIDSLSSARGEIGSLVSRLETAHENLVASQISQNDAASRILDADIAKTAADFTVNKIGQQASIAIQAQANLSAANVLQLLK